MQNVYRKHGFFEDLLYRNHIPGNDCSIMYTKYIYVCLEKNAIVCEHLFHFNETASKF